MQPVDLPGFRWDADQGVYINLRTGRPVSLQQMQTLVDERGDRDERWLLALMLMVHDGDLAPSVFARIGATTLQRMHLQNAALGAGGWDALDDEEIRRIEDAANSDTPKLLATVAALAAGAITLAVARERMKGYIGAARAQFYRAERERVQRPDAGTIIIERRLLGAARHCASCVGYYHQGWTLQGTLPPPGVDSECGHHCRCRMVRRVVPAIEAPLWIGTRRSF